jgi:hypothetical protein
MNHRHVCAIVFALLSISASLRGQDVTAVVMGALALIALAFVQLPARSHSPGDRP